jgi:hypothetical protein
MEQEERIAAIRARIDETSERIAEAICTGRSPVAAQRLLMGLAAELTKELQQGQAAGALNLTLARSP